MRHSGGRRRARALFGAVLYRGDPICDLRRGDDIFVSLGGLVFDARGRLPADADLWFGEHVCLFGDFDCGLRVALSQRRSGVGVTPGEKRADFPAVIWRPGIFLRGCPPLWRVLEPMVLL